MKKSRKLGVGLLELIMVALIVLVILKIFGVAIPWIWVLSPIWVPAFSLMIWITGWMLVTSFKERHEHRKRRKWH